MKKVGIMSMQRIVNYGSFLQSYGLKSLLEDLGHDVEFVDYHVEDCIVKETDSQNKIKRILTKVLEAFQIKTSLINKIKFVRYKATYTKKYLPELGVTKEPNYLPKLDTLVIGSDEVFNCIQGNTNVGYSLELFGKDNKAGRLISYAASFGNTTLDKISKYSKTEELSRYLSDFDALSLRDANSVNVVNALINKAVSKNMDPVLMYDFVNKCNKIPENLKINKPYIIVYGYSGRLSKQESKIVEKFAKDNKKEILFLGGIQHCKGTFIDCSPFEVLGYFKNADCIITDTFHGSIFSIINHKPFLTLVRKSNYNSYGNQEKLIDLLKSLGLMDRAVYDLNDIALIYNYIDYDSVDVILNTQRKITYQYLKENI